MSVYTPEEQENIDIIKSLWRRYQRWVFAVVAVVVLAWIGTMIWNAHRKSELEKAGSLYSAVEKALGSGDAKATLAAAQALEAQLPSSPYASLAAMKTASLLQSQNDAKTALAQWDWVVAHAGDSLMVSLAHLDKAAELGHEQQYEQALKELAGDGSKDFAALFADRRGDIYLAMNKPAEARAAWKEAVDKAPENGMLKGIAQGKLDALGGSK
jgi:predicted negative regulator of RcsB-dependent stress response